MALSLGVLLPTASPSGLRPLTQSSIYGTQLRPQFPTNSSSSSHSAFGVSSSSRHRRSPVVVMMAKREEEMKEIREKTTEELNNEIVDLKGELLMLRLDQSARNEFKPSEFGRMQKRIARMLTVKREREIEEGINKRLSRKLDRKWKKSIVIGPPLSLRKLQEEEAAAEAKKST